MIGKRELFSIRRPTYFVAVPTLERCGDQFALRSAGGRNRVDIRIAISRDPGNHDVLSIRRPCQGKPGCRMIRQA